MKTDKWIIACFSPTGGTGRIADAIAAGFETPTHKIDLTKTDASVRLGENDALLAVLPVFAGRVPQIALKRLTALKAHGQKAVAVVVYGNRAYDDALLETKDALEAQGFQVIAAAAFIAEHSIVRTIAAARPDAEDIRIARQFGADVMAKADRPGSVETPGSRPYRAISPSAYHPVADDNCVHCGLCAESCPVNAIPAEHPAQPLNDVCINCMRCVQVCPGQRRALPAAFMDMLTQKLNQTAADYKRPTLFL